MKQASVTAVVMAGGRGERLWPLVRRHTPKVCVSVDGRHTLLETTLGAIKNNSEVNLEVDVLARYLGRMRSFLPV